MSNAGLGRNLDNYGRYGSEDLIRAARQITWRLAALGIKLDGTESPELLAELVEAVEHFEDALEAHGSELVVREPETGARSQLTESDFALPRRSADESVRAYLTRLRRATKRLLTRSTSGQADS